MLLPRKYRKKAIVGAGLLGVVAAALLAWRIFYPPVAVPASVAIVRFRPLDDSPGEQALAMGLTETLKVALLSSGRLEVRDIRAAAAPDALAAGRRIAAAAVLTGTVQVTEDKAISRISLVRVADGRTLWEGVFEGSASNWFSLEDRAASGLLNTLLREIAVVQHHTADPEADRLYWSGRVGMEQGTPEGLVSATNFFETAARKDPAHALAWSGVAGSSLLRASWERARAAARRAVELDPTIAEPHTTLALIAQNSDWDWAEAEREYKRAIELNPNDADARHWYGEFLVLTGHAEPGLAELSRAEHLDPVSPGIGSAYTKCLYLARRYDDAIAQGRTSLAHHWLSGAYFQKGMDREFRSELQLDSPEAYETGLVLIAARNGDRQEVQRLLPVLETRLQAGRLTPFTMALVQTGIGNKDRAFQLLDEVYAKHEPAMVALKVDPGFDALRSDTRFNLLLRRMHLI